MKEHKKIIFKIIIILIPFLFFLSVEFLLRILNLFPQPPLFLNEIKNGIPLIQINSHIGERYFNEKGIPVPNLYPQTFSVLKEEHTFRVFCLGGSTTAGFPFEMNIPFPQQLKFILQNNYPEKKFEIINMGLSAINSFTVLDWLPEILGQHPDLIVIYMGHNEFYGAYGSGSAISLGKNGIIVRFVLSLNTLHFIQMIKKAINALIPSTDFDSDQTLMENITESKSIAPDSELRDIAYKNFRSNLELILDLCRENKIPVIISNLVSNLKDQAPLSSIGNSIPDSSNESIFYNKGVRYIQNGDSLKAYQQLKAALNFDRIPFRAPSKINTIIKEESDRFNIAYIDMLQVFRDHSPQRIPGNNLFSDHLHPTPNGYFLMACQFFNAMLDQNLLPAKDHIQIPDNPLYVTGIDWEMGFIKIFKLIHRWPFGNKEVTYSDYSPYQNHISARIAQDFLFNHRSWIKMHSDMAAYYKSHNLNDPACFEYQAISAMYPEQLDFYIKLIDCANSSGQWEIVEKACKKALQLTPNKGMFYLNLAHAQYALGKINSALQNMQNAANSPEITRDQRADAYYYLAQYLIEVNQYGDARKVLETLINKMPSYKAAKELLGKIN